MLLAHDALNLPFNYRQLYSAVKEGKAKLMQAKDPETSPAQAVSFQDETDELICCSIPIILRPILKTGSPYLKENHSFLILALQAESSGIMLCDGLNLLYLKIYRRYTVRKSQGKAQQKHLRAKGKSRLGSRIRLRQTQLLFEETSATLDTLMNQSVGAFFTAVTKRRQAEWLEAAEPKCWKFLENIQEPAGLDMPRPSRQSMLRLIYRMAQTQHLDQALYQPLS